MYSLIYTLATLCISTKQLFDMTQTSLSLVIVSQILLPKIAIITQLCFILIVLHGSYTYFWRVLWRFLSIDWAKILQNCGTQFLLGYNNNCCISYFRDVMLQFTKVCLIGLRYLKCLNVEWILWQLFLGQFLVAEFGQLAIIMCSEIYSTAHEQRCVRVYSPRSQLAFHMRFTRKPLCKWTVAWP